MPSTGLDVFDTTVQKTNQLLKQIEEQMGWEGRRNQSLAAFRAVMHELRDRLTVQEAADLAAQLPMLAKGIFYEGWNPSHVPVKMDREQFVENVREQFRFSAEGTINDVILAVISSLSDYVSEGELEDVLSVLPKDLKRMLSELQPARSR